MEIQEYWKKDALMFSLGVKELTEYEKVKQFGHTN